MHMAHGTLSIQVVVGFGSSLSSFEQLKIHTMPPTLSKGSHDSHDGHGGDGGDDGGGLFDQGAWGLMESWHAPSARE